MSNDARGLMSDMCQKWKCPGSRGTSVLPSGADIVSLPRHVRFVPISEVSELLFNHLVGASDERRRNGEAKRFRRLEIDDQLIFGWRLYREISRALAFEDAVHINRSTPIFVV